jgi:hypothetical protein
VRDALATLLLLFVLACLSLVAGLPPAAAAEVVVHLLLAGLAVVGVGVSVAAIAWIVG